MPPTNKQVFIFFIPMGIQSKECCSSIPNEICLIQSSICMHNSRDGARMRPSGWLSDSMVVCVDTNLEH